MSPSPRSPKASTAETPSALELLRTRRWLGWLALTCLFALLCGYLGMWQWHRREARLAYIAKVESNYDRSPLSGPQAESLFSQPWQDSSEWVPATLRGEYLPQSQIVVRNRPRNQTPGFDVLVPFRTDSGQVLIVDRGWVPGADSGQGQPAAIPAAPAGRIVLTVRAKPYEPQLKRGAPEGQVPSIHLEDIRAKTGLSPVSGAYGQLVEEKPAPSAAPAGFSPPSVDEGPHLSYAMQWFTFGLMMFVGFGYALRKEARGSEPDWTPPSLEGTSAELREQIEAAAREAQGSRFAAPGRLGGSSSAMSDEEAEDAWVEERLGPRA